MIDIIKLLMNKAHTFIYFIAQRIFALLPINDRKVFIDNFNGKGFSGNSKYVALELLKRNSGYKIIWVVNNDVDLKNFPESIITVKSRSIRAAYEIETSKYWIDNVRKNGFYKRKKHIYIQVWHGLLGIKLVEGQVSEKLSESYCRIAKLDSQATDILVAPCQRYEHIMKKYFWISPEKVICLGAPEFDALFANDISKKKRDIRHSLGIKNKKILLYAPTFRNNKKHDYFSIDFSKVLSTLAQKFGGDWVLAIRMHPNIMAVNHRNIKCPFIDVTNYDDCQELIIASDTLITDYSSIVFNSAIIHIPSFIHATDLKEYRDERDFEIPFSDLPFPISQTDDALLSNIVDYSNEKYNSNYDAFFSTIGVSFDNKASERVVDIMESLD